MLDALVAVTGCPTKASRCFQGIMTVVYAFTVNRSGCRVRVCIFGVVELNGVRRSLHQREGCADERARPIPP